MSKPGNEEAVGRSRKPVWVLVLVFVAVVSGYLAWVAQADSGPPRLTNEEIRRLPLGCTTYYDDGTRVAGICKDPT